MSCHLVIPASLDCKQRIESVDAVPREVIAAARRLTGLSTRRQYEYVSGRNLDFRCSDLFAVMGAQRIFNPVMNPLPYDPCLAMKWQLQGGGGAVCGMEWRP